MHMYARPEKEVVYMTCFSALSPLFNFIVLKGNYKSTLFSLPASSSRRTLLQCLLGRKSFGLTFLSFHRLFDDCRLFCILRRHGWALVGYGVCVFIGTLDLWFLCLVLTDG